MKPNRSTHDESTIPELDYQAVDESDNEAPGIMPSKTSTMPRAEDDAETMKRSPEFHDRKAPEVASPGAAKKTHSWE